MLWMIALLFTSPVASADGLLSGTWQGAIEIPGQPLEITMRFSPDGDDGWTGVGDIPAQGAMGLALTAIKLEGDLVAFAYADIPADFDGSLTADASRIEGVFNQAGMSFPFYIERVAQPGRAIETTQDLDGSREQSVESDSDRSVTIRRLVETVRDDWDVPGMAVGVVQDGEVLFAEGFGLRDLESGLPVTANTLFGIGSSTKAFTATVFQMLVEEDSLSWDRPIRQSIPGFRLSDPFATEHITPMDFALHRSGLPRHDIPWMFNPDLDLNTFIDAAEHLAPSADFRTAWMYNNFGYALLGRLIEDATGMAWETVVSERILQPLGMDTTNFRIADLLASEDHALAYTMDDGEAQGIPLQELGAAAAAGAINSNVTDMSKWLLFQLNQGRVGDAQLLSTIGIQQMQTPLMAIPGMGQQGIDFGSYGLGWMVDSYRGHYRVHHGGNTIGYSAEVAFLPRDGIGVVVLSNGLFTPANSIVVNHVLDTMLDLEPIDWNRQLHTAYEAQASLMETGVVEVGRKMGTLPAHELSEYAGVYVHPAYGEVHIAQTDGSLEAVYYTATIPLEHWHFEQFRGPLDPMLPIEVPFFFETDAEGEVSKVRIGFEPMVEPIPFTRRAGTELSDEDYLQQFVGEYDLMGQTIDVSLRGGTLFLTVPGQPAYALEPVREGRFAFRDFAGFGADFVVAEDGTVEKAVLIQPHGNVELLRRP